jgi:hypothetical protein
MIKSKNTFNSNSAPLITKKRIKIGAVQRSALAISSSEKSQILQNIVPNIIHVNSDENAICNPPISNFNVDNATAIITNVTVTAIRFEREWNNFSQSVNSKPKIAPNPNDRMISKIQEQIDDARQERENQKAKDNLTDMYS